MKKHLINKDNGNVEYVIKTKNTKNGDVKTILKTSKSNIWYEDAKNKKLIEVTDDGNGCYVKLSEENTILLDYSKIAELYLILNEIRKTSNFMPKYKRLTNGN